MRCIICDGESAFYFSKNFKEHQLGRVDYWRCQSCGFVLSRTHAEMAESEWNSLNEAYHAAYQGTGNNPDDPNWLARLASQADLLADAAGRGLIDAGGRWLDYACGDGKLSDALVPRGLHLGKYDRYMPPGDGFLTESDLQPGGFEFVITTSVFEHLLRRSDFDAIASLVSPRGVLGLHTLVCESVPCDPSWFYLLPVHCAFFTNRAMQVLFERWGYTCSVYNVQSRLWLWLRESPEDVARKLSTAGEAAPQYVFKPAFVDHWK